MTASLLMALALAGEPSQVLIPAGTFTMGRTSLTSDDKTGMRPEILLDDRPAHDVTVSAFHLDTHEATHAAYAACVAASKCPAPYNWVDGGVPSGMAKVAVYNVSWHDAKAYCEFRGGRLPTEAEWERAARGGLERKSYPWGEEFDATKVRSGVETGPGEVGKYPPNAFGLYDMAGNMAEWTADYFDRTYYEKSPPADPKGPADGAYRVIRGGAWSDPAKRVTVFFRNWVGPTQRQANIGIRCARSAD